jgi:probable HAF family extracellular repeat protein
MIIYKTIWRAPKKSFMLAVIYVSLLLSHTAPAIAVEYEYTELNMIPTGINNSGDVVGGRFLYRDGEYTEILPSTIYYYEGLNDINDSGVIVGTRDVVVNGTGHRKGFIYKDGEYTYLPVLPPRLFDSLQAQSSATRINNKGVVIGNFLPGPPIYIWSVPRGFIYRNGVYTVMQKPLGWRVGWTSILFLGVFPSDINDNGVVVGNAQSFNSRLGTDNKGFIYYLGLYRWLKPLGFRTSTITGINNKGMVVGYGNEGNNIYSTGFVYGGGKFIDIVPERYQYSTAEDINDKGEIVGIAWNSDLNVNSILKSFLYQNGEYSEIAVPGWLTTQVTRINNSGVVIGRGRDSIDRLEKGFIAVPK